MNQKYTIIIVSAVVAVVFIGSMYVMWNSTGPQEFQGFSEKRQERTDVIRDTITNRIQEIIQERLKDDQRPMPIRVESRPLGEEERVPAATLVGEDDLMKTLLEYLENPQPRIMKGVKQGTIVLQYPSEKDWVMHVTVNQGTREIETITLTRRGMGMTQLFNPKDVIKVAETHLGQRIGEPPLMGKVVQTGEGIEVQFLTEKGITKVTMKVEDGKITGIETTPGEGPVVNPLRWKWPAVIGGSVVLALIVIAALYQRRKGHHPEEPESGSEIESEEGNEP
jgi:hypothetical protein